MTVMTRNTPGAPLLRRRRDGRPGRVAEPARVSETHRAHGTAPATESAPSPTGTITAARPRRRLDVPQDRATYACRCGYVFEAAVSTSVGCPHCGDAQAW
jgi:rubrerythrin